MNTLHFKCTKQHLGLLYIRVPWQLSHKRYFVRTVPNKTASVNATLEWFPGCCYAVVRVWVARSLPCSYYAVLSHSTMCNYTCLLPEKKDMKIKPLEKERGGNRQTYSEDVLVVIDLSQCQTVFGFPAHLCFSHKMPLACLNDPRPRRWDVLFISPDPENTTTDFLYLSFNFSENVNSLPNVPCPWNSGLFTPVSYKLR